MTSVRFNDYDELDSYIKSLRSPKPGYIRVFRGQNRDYGNMRPTGVRVPLRNERIWRQYCKMLATEMLMHRGLEFDDALSTSDLWAYWYYAIVQHYGPGTHLLDVTHALDVALWFALNEATTDKRITTTFLNTDPANFGPALDRRDDWTSYSKWRGAPGWLYIFDVPEWAPPGLPSHGSLVDLAHAPDVFTASARIQAQKACLIAADVHDPSGGDLVHSLAHSPIQVEWPMIGCTTVNLSTEDLFPSPKEDEWYARLLFLPVIHQVSHEEPYWRMGHPVPLSLYIEQLEPSMYAVQFKPLQPPLLYRWLIFPALLKHPTDSASYEKAASFFQTLPILLEAPIFALQQDKSWNQELLASSLPDVLGVSDLVKGELSEAPEIFTNVLFELSPLEFTGWSYLLKEGAELVVPRAVHLVQEDEFKWRLQVFFQNAPKEQVGMLFDEAAAIRFDWSSRRFQIKKSNKWKDISIDPVAAKALFGALAILRDLSPDLKPRASLNSSSNTDRDVPAASAPIESTGALAVLKRAPDIGLGVRYFVLRDPETNEPYTGEKETPQQLNIPSDAPSYVRKANHVRGRRKKKAKP